MAGLVLGSFPNPVAYNSWFSTSVTVFSPRGLAFTESNPIFIHKGQAQLPGGVTDKNNSKDGELAWKCDGLCLFFHGKDLKMNVTPLRPVYRNTCRHA